MKNLPDDRAKWRNWVEELEKADDAESEPLDLNEETKRAAAEFLADTEASCADHTLKNRKTALKQWLRHLQEYDNDLLDAADSSRPANRFKNRLLNADYSARTVRQKLYAVSAIYNSLIKLDYVENNPTEDLEQLKKLTQTKRSEHSPREFLKVDEYQELVDGADRLRDKIIIKLLFQTGVRAQEAVQITKDAIDFEDRKIEIETVKQGEHAEKETRNVYFRRSLRRDLRAFFNDGHRLAYPPASDERPKYLLVSKQAAPMQPQRISEILHEIASKDSVELEHYDEEEGMYTDVSGATRHWLSAHLLRKSYAVHRVKQGMPIVYLTDTLGHADVETTKETYLDYRDDDVREADEHYSPL